MNLREENKNSPNSILYSLSLESLPAQSKSLLQFTAKNHRIPRNHVAETALPLDAKKRCINDGFIWYSRQNFESRCLACSICFCVLMMQIVESGDDYFEPRFSNGSMSCLFPSLAFIDSPRKSSYKKLQKNPLRLTVIKLDESSFGIEVPKNGTVAELKRAVEAVFDHFPKMGPGRVSWELVWGQFCLCHEGQKLLNDSDYISMIGIRDGDELQFVHHASNTCNFVKIKSSKEDPDVDYIPRITNGYDDGQQNHGRDDSSHSEITEDNEPDNSESEDDTLSQREHKLTNMLKGWFPYQKLNNSHKRLGDRRCSSTSSPSMLGSFKNRIRFSSDRYDSRGAWKP